MTSQSPLIPLLVTLLSLGRFSSSQSADHTEFRVWPGGSMTLPCLVPAGSSNGTSFKWLKQSFAIAGTNTTSQNARVSTGKHFSLEIKNTTPQDSGIYTCVVSEAERRSEAPVRLTVATDLKQTPRLVTVYPGDSFTVSCREPLKTPLGPIGLYRSNAAGSETLVSTFMKNRGMENRPGVRMTSGRDGEWIFEVEGVTAADEGDYICKKFRKMSGKEEEVIGQGEKTKVSVGVSQTIITQDPASVTGTEEGEVTVPCTVTEAPPGPVRWYRDTGSGRQYLYSTSAAPPNERNDPRVSQVHQHHATDLSIRIVRLTVNDSGTYYCEKYRWFDETLIARGSGSSLSVRGVSQSSITQDPGSVIGTEEGEVTVPCTVTGARPGPVRWYRDTGSGRQYLYSTSPPPNERNDPRVSQVHQNHDTDLSIRIVNLNLHDSGTYYCEKYRGFDVTLIASGSGSRLSVRGVSQSSITQDPGSVIGTEEGEVTVPCTVTGAPPGPVRWYRDTGSGRQYLYSTSPPPNERNDPRVSQVHQNHDTDLSIRIVNLNLHDSGTYYCEKYRGFDVTLIASGSGSRLSVRERSPISITQDPDPVNGTEEGEVTLPCTLSRVGPPGPVRWYRGTDRGREYLYSTPPPLPNERNDPRVSRVHPDHPTDLSIRIVSLTLHDSGTYHCYKYRGFEETPIARGSGSRLSVRALPPPIITQPPHSVTGTEEGEVTLPCTLSTVGAAGPVRWYRGTLRDRQHLYSTARPPPNESNDPRVSRVHPDHPTDLSIRIVMLNLRDSGTYYCEKYRGFDGSQIASGSGTWLRVRALPPPIITQPPHSVTGTEEGEVTLPCTLSTVGAAGPVRWYRGTLRDRQHLYSTARPPPNESNDPRVSRVHPDHPTDLSIRIVMLNLRDSGTYYCEKYRGFDGSQIASGSGTWLRVRERSPISITQDPDPVNGTEEGEVTLRCTLSRVGPPGPVRWYRGTDRGREYLYSTFPLLPNERNDPRVSRVHPDHPTDLSIRIVRLTLRDSGRYHCYKYRGIDETPIATGSGSSLSVRAIPALIITQDPGSVTGTEEGEVTVPCTVTGGTAGPVRWYRDSGSGRQYLYSPSPPPPNERNDPRVSQVHQHHPTDLSIRIVRLNLRDSGTYYCAKYKAFDGSLIASGAGSRLSVRAIPPPIITQDPDSVTGTEEGEVTVPCTLSTVGPAGPVRWYRGTDSGRQYLYSTDPLPNDSNDPRVSRVHPDHPTDLSIRIVNLTVSDSGTYYCEKYRGFDGSLIAVGTGSSVRATPPRCHGYEKAWLPCLDGPSPSGKAILGESLSEFSVSLYRAVAHAQTSPRNLFFSPLSVAMALSHLLLGARGDAQTALEEALFLPQNFECLHKELRSLSSRNLLTASQIYVRPGLELQEFFKDQSKEFYGEGPQLLTNDSEANVRMVNEWVAEHTEHKITRLVDDVPATTELLLLNAIYYQGKWKVRFDVKETVKERFMSFGKHVEVPMMKSQGYKLTSLHHRGLQAKVGRFLLSGDTSLLVLLPTDPSLDSLLALESRLSSKLLADVVQQLSQATPHSTVVSLPKLRLDVQTDLAYILEKLGLSELFSSPNLCGLTPEAGVFVSDALHRAVLDLGESGVEAAGVTSVSLARSVFVFDALQPFMLVLWDDALRAPLFMGRVTDPSLPN